MSRQKYSYLSKLSIPGKNTQDLSYIFSDSIDIDTEQRIYVFGIFLIQSQKEQYQSFIKVCVDSFLDFYHKSLASYKNVLDESSVNSHEFLFENAIRYVHEQLLQTVLSENHESTNQLDLKKIHFSLGVLAQDHIYVSGSGSKIFGYYIYPVFSKNKGFSHYALSSLLDGNTENDGSNKLFSYLINGPVSLPGGSLCLLNKALLEYLSIEQLRHILTNNPIEKVSTYIHALLSKINSKNDFLALFINPSYSGPQQHTQHSKQTASSRSMAGLNSTEHGTEQVLSPTFKPMVKNTTLHAFDFARTISSVLFRTTHSFAKKIPLIISRAKNIILICTKRIHSCVTYVFPFFYKIYTVLYHLGSQLVFAFTLLIKKGPGAFTVLIKKKLTCIGSFFTNFFQSLKRTLLSFVTIHQKKFQILSPRSKALLGIGCLFLFLFTVSITTLYSRQMQSKVDSTHAQSLADIQREYTSLESRSIYEQGEGLKADLLTLQQKLLDLKKVFPPTDTSLEKLQDRINFLKQKMFSIYTLDTPHVLTQIPIEYGEPLHLLPLQKKLILVFNSHIVVYSLVEKTFKALETTGQFSSNCLTNFSVDSAFVCVQDSDKLYLVTNQKNEVTTYSMKKNIPEKNTAALAAYNNKLYTLDTEQKNIFRHIKNGVVFEQGNKVLQKELPALNLGRQLVIDGSLFVLTTEDKILKITKGKSSLVSLPTLDPIVVLIEKILTHENTPYLFLLDTDQKRIIVIDKLSEKLIVQLTSPRFENLKNISLTTDGKELYVLTSQEVFNIPVKSILNTP